MESLVEEAMDFAANNPNSIQAPSKKVDEKNKAE